MSSAISFILVLATFLGIAVGIFLIDKTAHAPEISPVQSAPPLVSPLAKSWIKINETIIVVDVAQTEFERVQGLSGRPQLTPHEGMLFIEPGPGKPKFWMKDMKFPIDIIWIGSGNAVVDITENFLPESYPATAEPKSDAQYVLEVSAGWARMNKVSIGDIVTIGTIPSPGN